MNQRQKIILYGDSIILAGIKASLQHNIDFDVSIIDLEVPQPELFKGCSGAIIFDTSVTQAETLLSQAQGVPNLLFIGINSESHEMLITGEAASSITIDQVVKIICTHETK